MFRILHQAVLYGLLGAGEGIIDAGCGLGFVLFFTAFLLHTSEIFGFDVDRVGSLDSAKDFPPRVNMCANELTCSDPCPPVNRTV